LTTNHGLLPSNMRSVSELVSKYIIYHVKLMTLTVHWQKKNSFYHSVIIVQILSEMRH